MSDTLSTPTATPPGPAKVRVLAARAAEAEALLRRGVVPPPLFHPADAGMPQAGSPGGSGPPAGGPACTEQAPHGNTRGAGGGIHLQDGGWVARVVVGGKRLKRRFPLDERAAAERWVREMRARRDRGEGPPPRAT